jgi:PST family polysaccharide transporter
MVLRFGMSLQGQVAINYISRRLDDAIVGRYAGASALGQYSRAYQLMLYPVQNIAGVMGRVMFPALAEIGTDLPRFRSAYLRAISGIALVAFPAMLGLLVTAQEVVPVVYGRQWQPAVPILQVLCFVGLIQSIATTVGWIYMARGATGLMFKWAAFATTVVCCAFLIGIRWGALGVAISYALAMAVLVIPGFAVPFRLISLPVRSLLGATRSAIVGATLMATAVCAIRFALERAGYGPTAILVVCVMSGTLVYLVWLAIERPEPVKGFLSAFSERLRAADSPPRSER